MMRNNNTKLLGKVESVNSNTPVENGFLPKEDDVGEEDEQEESVRAVAAKVVENVVRMASAAAEQRRTTQPLKTRGCSVQRLPTIQIDTVPSAPPSPEWSPVNENNGDQPVDESEIQLDLELDQESDFASDNLREFLKSYVEDILSQAMVVAEKKLQFAGLPEDDEDESEEEQPESVSSVPEPEKEPEKEEVDESEIRAAAEKVVEEVISKATETVAERMEKSASLLTFPITFDEAPDDVKELATSFVKEIVGRAVTLAEEKAVPTVPFNFEDVELMKTSGPWYIRAREALVRVLRTACFCTPRRNDS